MFDVITYALLKKQIASAATGIEKVEYINGSLIFTSPDGSTIETPLDIESFGASNVSFDPTTNTLTFIFNDNSTLSFSAPSKEEFTILQNSVTALATAHEELQSSFEDLGLSVVDGKLCITWRNQP